MPMDGAGQGAGARNLCKMTVLYLAFQKMDSADLTACRRKLQLLSGIAGHSWARGVPRGVLHPDGDIDLKFIFNYI